MMVRMRSHVRLAVAAAMSALGHAISLPNNTLEWKPLGEPGCGGDITAVRINPYNTSQVFMSGDMLGVGVSLDAGSTWLAPHAGSFLSWESADFSFDPVLQRIYVSTLSGPYFAPFSDPLSWTSIRQGMPPPNWGTYEASIQQVLVDPTSNGQRLLAFGGNKRGWPRVGNQGIVWESTNAGANWTNMTTIAQGKSIHYAGWCGNSCIWAAVVGAGMFQSTDGGRSWTSRSSGINSDFSFGYAQAHPSDPNTAWVAMCDGSGVFKTTNGGASWAASNSGLGTGGGVCYEAFGVSPSNPSILYAGNGNEGNNIWVSQDGGNTWNASGKPPSAQAYGLGLQSSFLTVHPCDPQTVFYATWVTLWVTRDGGSTWKDLTAFQPYSNDTTGTIWRGTGYSGLVSTNVKWNPYSTPVLGYPRAFVQGMDAGKIWGSADASMYAWQRQTGLNEFGGGNDVAFGADGLTVYAGTGQYGWPSSFSTEGVVLSKDGGNTWSYACGHPNVGANTVVAPSVYTVPYNTSSVWAVFSDRKLYFSSNGCTNWTVVSTANDTLYWLSAVPGEISPDPAQTVMYAAGNKGVWATGPGWTQGLHEWVLLPGGPTAWTYSQNWCTLSAAAPSGTLVCANPFWDQWHSGLWTLNVSQAQAHVASNGTGPNGWSGGAGHPVLDGTVYRWTDSAPGKGLVQACASNENPYPEASPATGVWLTLDGGATWSMQTEGLRLRRVAALAFSPDGTRLVAGLNGGGFYVADTSALAGLALSAKAQREKQE